MKKEFLFISILILFITPVNSQNLKFSGEVLYEKTQRNPEIIKTTAQLYFNNTKSYFEWFSRQTGVKKSPNGTTTYYANSQKTADKPFFMYNNFLEDEFFTHLINDDKFFLIKQSTNFIEWELTNEVKHIDQFLCRKALATFKGRNYVAWFSPEIPVQFGPAFFHGLNGLILEVYEENYFVHFLAKEITVTKTDLDFEEKLKNIDFTNTISISDYEVEIEKHVKDLEQKINSRLPKGSKPIRFNNNCNNCGEKTEIN